jgi:hypothetical protein
MPIGPWKDFESCVRANQDKRDPEAYCAQIERQMGASMWITADLVFDSDAEAREAERLVREGKLATLSVRLANVTSKLEVLAMGEDGSPTDWLETIESAEIVSVTQLPVPAQGGARIVANPDGTYTAWMVEEGEPTSDRRVISPGALTWRDPAPLTFSDREDGAHENAIHVGNLTNFQRSALALVATITPVPEHFADPMLPAVTKPHLEAGRYVGHGAQWGTCHLAFSGCVTPPTTETGYALARWKEVDGVLGVPVYKNPEGDRHAPGHLTMEETQAWYDDHCSLEGLVEVGDDTFGIWLAGDATDEIDGMFVSGDWRLSGDNLELVAFLACERPAFPLALVASDHQVSLVAAGVVLETAEPDPTLEVVRTLAREVVVMRQDLDEVLIDREAERLIESLSA